MVEKSCEEIGAFKMNKNVSTSGTFTAPKSVWTGRLEKAKQFFAVADDAELLADSGSDISDAAVTLYVHAGIAASDAICGKALGVHAKGQSHHEAVSLLASVDNQAAKNLKKLLDMKTRAGYGHDPISQEKLKVAQRSAQQLIERALM